MRYELRRLDILGARFPAHPSHNLRHLAVKDAVLSSPGTEVLILGCGKGFLEYLLPQGLACVSVDVDEQQIEAAREVNRYCSNRSFEVGDINSLRDIVGDRKFSTVVISEVLEHLENDRGALRSASSHLLAGGRLVLTVPNCQRFQNRVLRLLARQPFMMARDHVREYTLNGARRLLRDVGYEILWWKGLWFEFPRPYTVERWVSPYSRVRSALATLFPRWATYFVFVCRLARSNSTAREARAN